MIFHDKWHTVPLKKAASLTLKSWSDWALSGDPATAVDVSLPISGALCLFDLCCFEPILRNRYVRYRGFIVSEPRETHVMGRRDIKLFPATMKKIDRGLRVTSHKMLIQVLPSNMLAQPYTAQPQFYPGEILINGTCVRPPSKPPPL